MNRTVINSLKGTLFSIFRLLNNLKFKEPFNKSEINNRFGFPNIIARTGRSYLSLFTATNVTFVHLE